MAEFRVGNPENSPWWMSRLIWLLDSSPDLALEWWNSPNHDKLLEHLDRMTVQAAYLDEMLGEMPEDAKQEMLAAAICPADVDEPEEEMPEETRLKILEWAENLEFPNRTGEDARVVTITVP